MMAALMAPEDSWNRLPDALLKYKFRPEVLACTDNPVEDGCSPFKKISSWKIADQIIQCPKDDRKNNIASWKIAAKMMMMIL